MSRAREVRYIDVEKLRLLMERMLRAAGCDEKSASVCTGVFLDADLKGVGLQGLDHMSTLVRHLRIGHTRPSARPKVVRELAASALVDGGHGLGQLNAIFASDVAVRKAREAGVAAVGVVNSGDVFMVGHYAERIAAAGCVALVFSDAPPLVHPYGGLERMLGTNPLAIAVPGEKGPTLVFDMATSALSASRVRQAAYFDEPVPPGTGVDAAGEPTECPSDIRDGAIGPLGGHKGFGLALCVALLSGPLVGGFCGPALNSWMGEKAQQIVARGQLFIAIDPDAFGDPSVFHAKVSAYLQEIKNSRLAEGVDEIRIPGERSRSIRARQRAEGRVAIYDAVWQRALELAKSLGVELPESV